MCEQCMPVSTGYRSHRFAIRSCPRLASLGPATVEWLNQAIITEVRDEIAIEREDPQQHAQRPDTQPLPRWMRVAIGTMLIAALIVGLVGIVRAHVLWEWWRAKPTDIMLASGLLIQTLIAATLIRLLPRRRHHHDAS